MCIKLYKFIFAYVVSFSCKKKCVSSWISSSLHMLYHFTSWTLKVVVTLPVFQSTKTWCLVVIIRTSSRLNTRGRGNGTCLKITHHCFKLHCVIESTKIKRKISMLKILWMSLCHCCFCLNNFCTNYYYYLLIIVTTSSLLKNKLYYL